MLWTLLSSVHCGSLSEGLWSANNREGFQTLCVVADVTESADFLLQHFILVPLSCTWGSSIRWRERKVTSVVLTELFRRQNNSKPFIRCTLAKLCSYRARRVLLRHLTHSILYCTHTDVGFSLLLKDTSVCGAEKQRIGPLSFWLIHRQLYHLIHSCTIDGLH